MKHICNKISGLMVCGLLLLSSCDNWLEVEPADRISSERVFSTPSGFWGALNGVYTEMISSDLYGGFLTTTGVEVMAQRYNVGTSHNFYNYSQYAYTSSNVKNQLENYWNDAYKQILDCNNLLKNAEEQHGTVLNDKQYSILKGEAMALRAFLHFDLLRVFGPIPAAVNLDKTAIPYKTDANVTATDLLTLNQVVAKVLEDLTAAENLLKQYDPAVTEGMLMSGNTDEKSNDGNTYRYRGLRMNYYAVLALKARVNLWARNTEEALNYAKMIIENPDAATLYPGVTRAQATDYSNPDRAFSSECLFSLLNENKESIFNTYFSTTSSVNNRLVPLAQRITNLFGDDKLTDYRTYWWAATSSMGTAETDVQMNVRFQPINNTDLVHGKLMPLIRVSEMYLIAAECETDNTKKLEYLNAHRLRRGNPVEITSASAVATQLANEYAKEFVNEGQLWFYYKRIGKTPIQAGYSTANITMNAAKYVPSIPDSELKYRN